MKGTDTKRKGEYFYLYNPDQACFFFENGAEILKIGKGSKGDTYIKFARNEKENEIFDKWIKQCEINRVNRTNKV